MQIQVVDMSVPAASALAAALAAYPVPHGLVHAYGTAGFRALATTLPHVMVRVGALAALRSRVCGAQAIGVMVTASHNAERDNGVKIVDPLGDMLVQEWEAAATRLANADAAAALDELRALGAVHGVSDAHAATSPALVFVGRDLRESSASLHDALCAGAEAAGATVVRIGEVTTPQLHFCVRTYNMRVAAAGVAAAPSLADVSRVLLAEYYASIGAAFADATHLAGVVFDSAAAADLCVRVDCANGVGARALDGFQALAQLGACRVRLDGINNTPQPVRLDSIS
jgi:phosphoacetylglucosamine mutase